MLQYINFIVGVFVILFGVYVFVRYHLTYRTYEKVGLKEDKDGNPVSIRRDLYFFASLMGISWGAVLVTSNTETAIKLGIVAIIFTGGALYYKAKEVQYYNRREAEKLYAEQHPELPDPLKAPLPQKPIVIPYELRLEHTWIVGSSGQGKSQLIQSMILDDVNQGNSVVVIDSQGDMINTLATRLSERDVILIDPEHCPVGINLFTNTTSEEGIATAVEFYEYIFSALDAQMTSKQRTVYRFVTRLLLQMPSANIHTMRQVLEGSLTINTANLNETAKAFFENEYDTRQYSETRKEILRRLYTVLENTTLERMLRATNSELNIGEFIADGKVILINTAKNYLKQTGASLFGRIFIAQVMQAVMGRKNRKDTFLYIDEFQDYAEESHVLFNLFEQARKYRLGMVIAHQYLGQLPPKLQQSISANTSSKYAGGVSAQDARTLGPQLNTTPEFIQKQKKGNFAAYFKGHGTWSFPVELGRLERMKEITDISALREEMQGRYGVKDEPQALLKVAETSGKYQFDEDFEDRN